MKKRFILFLFLLLIILSNCQSRNFYGIYQNEYHETWNLYKKNDKIFLSCYTYRIFKDKIFEVYIDNNNLDKQIILKPKNDKVIFILSKISNIWYLEIQYPNGKIRREKEFKKVSNNISDDELKKLKYESEILSEAIVNNEGYHYTNEDKLYYIYPEYPKIYLLEYTYDNNYFIVSEKSGEIYLNNGELLFQIDNESNKFQNFKDKTIQWGYEYKKLFKIGSRIVDAVYEFNRIDIVKDFGLSDKAKSSLKNSKVLISLLGNLLINSTNNDILDVIPRFGGGVQGEDGISIETKIENKNFPNEIKVNIFNAYNEILDFENGIIEPLYDYKINVYFKLEEKR